MDRARATGQYAHVESSEPRPHERDRVDICGGEAMTDEPARAEANIDTALRLMRAVHRRNADTVAECITEDYALVYPRPGVAGRQQGLQGIDGMRNLMRTLPYQPGSLEMTVESILAQGDWVAVQYRLNGTTLQGEPYENFYAHFHQFRGDLVARSWEYCDTLYGMRMLHPEVSAG